MGFKVWHDDDYINGIRFFYEKQTQQIWTPVYGSQVGQVVEVCILLYFSNSLFRFASLDFTVISRDFLSWTLTLIHDIRNFHHGTLP